MLKSLPRELTTSLRLILLMALVCCLAYTYAVTGVAQVLFSNQANGSLVNRGGEALEADRPELHRPEVLQRASVGDGQRQ